MNVAFVAFDEMTALDFVGAFGPVTRLRTMGFREELDWDVCARTETVEATGGLRLTPDRVDEPLSGYDLLVVPGGAGTRKLVDDEAFVGWLRNADAELTASVCTGSLLLGAASYLEGRRATTHPDAYDLLEPYCEAVVEERVVDEGEVVTARGVSSSLDLGLALVERLAGREMREAIRERMDYPERA